MKYIVCNYPEVLCADEWQYIWSERNFKEVYSNNRFWGIVLEKQQVKSLSWETTKEISQLMSLFEYLGFLCEVLRVKNSI